MKPKIKSIRIYGDTLEEVKKLIADDPRKTIVGFCDSAIQEKIKYLHEQKARLSSRRPDISEAFEETGRED